MIIAEYIAANKEFRKDKEVIEGQHLVWVLFLEADSWISEYQANELAVTSHLLNIITFMEITKN